MFNLPRNTILMGLGVLFVLGGLIYLGVTFVSNQAPKGNVACSQDARLCPDGTSVTRKPPSCEFAICDAPTK